jgi:hypothetical protein
MYRGIIQSALANRLPLELDYREPAADDGFADEEFLAAQPMSEELACILHTLCSGLENLQ